MVITVVMTKEEVVQAALDLVSRTYPALWASMGDIEVLPSTDEDGDFSGVVISGNPLA